MRNREQNSKKSQAVSRTRCVLLFQLVASRTFVNAGHRHAHRPRHVANRHLQVRVVGFDVLASLTETDDLTQVLENVGGAGLGNLDGARGKGQSGSMGMKKRNGQVINNSRRNNAYQWFQEKMRCMISFVRYLAFEELEEGLEVLSGLVPCGLGILAVR